MDQLKPMERYPVVFLTSILLIVIFIPSPAQGLCINPEACGIIVGTWLSMLTVPLCIVAFLFAIWPKTRRWLQVFAVLPGGMAILTGYLMVIRVNSVDFLFIPLIHFGLMIVMIAIGRFDRHKESKNEET
jgi:hypothetical protein|tara:strand:- start:261 stop:650 length:390 start_codon:yes stop_codon:yes gene_type:complete